MRKILRPVSKPRPSMVELGVNPHISHEHDIPKAVREMVAKCNELGSNIERWFDEDKNTTWREHCKLLAARIRNQRGEIARLHKKVRELRADVHERDEIIEELRAR